jgi:hypothetical protein
MLNSLSILSNVYLGYLIIPYHNLKINFYIFFQYDQYDQYDPFSFILPFTKIYYNNVVHSVLFFKAIDHFKK